ncbi:serine protease htrA-like protein [Striga asiatica]|uniref:Serine protease htrA-like protein n=1 Tax=Striga asiatica TaxID=4170 RepID=A0A5A7PX89_STRAF|nr:serine protease htrA-like protein [Striga asiatica]
MVKESRTQDYPWNLKPHRKHSFSNCSSNLSFDLKRVALEASTSVVGILSYLDDTKAIRGSGFVVESVVKEGKFISTIFTSATILRPECDVDDVAENIKISVILFNDITLEAKVFGWDFHYNIGVLKIETDVPIPTSKLRHINDSINIDPDLLDEKPPKFDPQSNKFNLVPGDVVVALGRNHADEHGLMVVDGKFSGNVSELDCEELFRADMKISLVRASFGYAYYIRSCLVPQIGVVLRNIYELEADDLELLIQTFPNTFDGVFVKEISTLKLVDQDLSERPYKELPRDQLLPLDIIVGCDGKSIRSVLELFELIWDEAGQSVLLDVLRPRDGSKWDITMVVDAVHPNKFNKWPLPKIRLPPARKRLGIHIIDMVKQ